MSLLFVEYPKCTTCQKAKKWLAAANVEFEDRHIVIRTYPDKDYVRITIGNKEENQKVFEVLKQFEKEIL